jgi:hypothetical protein
LLASGVFEESRSNGPACVVSGFVLTGVWFFIAGTSRASATPRGGVPINMMLSSGSLSAKYIKKLSKLEANVSDD